MEFDLENPLLTSEDLHFNTLTFLFHIESDHMLPNTYSQSLMATDFDSSIRRQTISLILHFSQNFDPFLSYLAINYLDRFLSTQLIPEGKVWILRLVAISCVSLALKMRKTEFSITDIQHDGGLIFDAETIQRMELLILGALKWRMCPITPFSFINFFISLFKFEDPPLRQALKARATEIIFKAQNEFKVLEFKPSMVAASALLSASHELFPLQFTCFKKAISNCSYVNKDNFLNCYNVVQGIARDGYESLLDIVSDSEKTDPIESIATASIRLERDVKRRKISGFKSGKTVSAFSNSIVLRREKERR